MQIAALQGFRIIATCSPKHFDAVRKMGATHVFDYKSNDIVAQVQNVAPRLKYAFDTIGNATSSVLAAQAVASNNGSLCTVRPGKANTENVDPNVKISDVLVWTAFLKEHRYGNYYWPVGASLRIKLHTDMVCSPKKMITSCAPSFSRSCLGGFSLVHCNPVLCS